MKIISLLCITTCLSLHGADDSDITWLFTYDGKAMPDSTWSAVGKPNAKIANGTLHLVDDSATEPGAFRAAWKPQPDTEIVVDAKVRVEFVKARRDGTGMWPAQQGVPVGLLVSDGKHREGLLQTWSHDGGKTRDKLKPLEVGSVAPDMVIMSNGVLVCSCGRPGSNLMFSTDQGHTWRHHTVITDSGGFNYTAVREVSPGRLLYIHDAPNLRALYVDVEIVK